MRDQSLRGFVKSLEQHGELVRITEEVDPLVNMAAVEWKTYNELGKASLFTNIKGHPDWEACSQILCDRRKWAAAYGIEESDVLEYVLSHIANPVDTVDVKAADAPIKEVILTGEAATLAAIPIMKISQDDPAPFMASGMAIIKDPDTGIRNMSVHRQHVMGPQKTGFPMVPRHAFGIYQKYCERNEPMPVAMVIGAHPAVFYAAAFTTSEGFDELTVAGGLLEDGIRMVKCETIDVEVPAEAELVIEGEVLPNHTEREAPFGEVTGTYAAEDDSPIFRVKAITHRKNPVYYAIHCGAPVTDAQATTGLGIEAATWEHLRKVDGGLDLMDVRSITAAGTMATVIKLRPRTEGEAKTALMAALSGPYQHPKLAIAVDEDIDPTDLRQIMWSITTRVHAEDDVTLLPKSKVFALDNISPIVEGQNRLNRIGTKWMIDATMPSLSQPEYRKLFALALPNGFDDVEVSDFVPL